MVTPTEKSCVGAKPQPGVAASSGDLEDCVVAVATQGAVAVAHNDSRNKKTGGSAND